VLKQTLAAAAAGVIVGRGFIVRVKLTPTLLAHPFAFFTVMVPVYVLGAALAGTAIVIGLAGNSASVTATNPAVVAAAFHVILYVVGVLVVAL
jgi:hypothetical protein